jgi:hypothetical protein
MKRLLPAIILCLFLGGVRYSSAYTLYVPSGDYPTIQSAIDDANTGDTIIVSEDRYYENIDFLGKAITVRSTNPDDANIVAATIIDGNQPSDVNKGSVVTFRSGEGNDSVLSGFTITGGTGSWITLGWNPYGIRWNRCGGGVLCYNMSEPTIIKNRFINNIAGLGGGIFVYGDPVNPNAPSNPAARLKPVIINNTFIDNKAVQEHGFSPPNDDYPTYDHGDGGAIAAFQGCDPNIRGNLIQQNKADMYGAGIHFRQWCKGLIEDNQIIENDSRLGSGVHITYDSSPVIRGNLIKSNKATTLGGAGIYCIKESNPLIETNHITGNYCKNGSAIFMRSSSSPVIRSNLIENNYPGVVISCTNTFSWMHHNTIINNDTTEAYNPGIIECLGPNYPKIENNIISTTANCYGAYLADAGNSVIRYNNFYQRGLGPFGPDVNDVNVVEGNLFYNLQSIDQSAHLAYTSPLIGAGDPNFSAEAGETDFDGDSRVMNNRTDIGADEAYPVWNITKDKQYLQIQPAIDDANEYDVIIATRGRYFEKLNIGPNSISLRSLNPKSRDYINATVIDGNETVSAVVTFSGAEDANCLLSGFTITGANNAGAGGGIAGNGSGATVSWCSIKANKASDGGGIYDFDGLITNCEISNNLSSGNGGGARGCDGQIFNCIISDNNSVSGGGLYDCNAVIVNNTIVSNNGVLSGGGLELCKNKISNSIIWSNTSADGAGLKNCTEPSYCCLQSAGAGAGNIFVEPLFVDADGGDYHLTVYSDCIDAGDNNSLPAHNNFDIDNEERIYIFDDDKIAVIDMGADEVTTKPGDFNDDGVVDYNDLAKLLSEWLDTGSLLECDITGDEIVDFKDYALLSQDWLWEAPWYKPEHRSALKFDSSTDGYVWIHTPGGNILNNNYTFTYTAWVYPLDFPQSNARIIGKNERAFEISVGGVLKGYSNGFKTAQSASVPGTLQASRWYFIVMTRSVETDDQRIRLYVDGEEVSYQQQYVAQNTTHPHPDWRAEGEWDLMIGAEAWLPAGENIPDAIIDEVGIYNRVLSLEEIQYLYNNGFGRPTASLNPIGLWHIDDATGVTVTDGSGNGNDGVLQGTEPPEWKDGKFLNY